MKVNKRTAAPTKANIQTIEVELSTISIIAAEVLVSPPILENLLKQELKEEPAIGPQRSPNDDQTMTRSVGRGARPPRVHGLSQNDSGFQIRHRFITMDFD